MKNLTINYKSIYYNYAGNTLNWLPSDTKELFIENLKNRKQELINNNWLPIQKINYTFNSQGFRSDEFTMNPNSIMFLGCSYTIGIGIHFENTFSYITSKKLNLENINLGIAGSSSNTAFRLGSHWIPILKPKIVVYLESSKERFEIVTDNFIHNLIPSYVQGRLKTFYEDFWLSDDTNFYLNSLKNKLALEFICKQHNIKFVYSDLFSISKTVDFARDLMHFGPISHLNLSDKLLTLIN